MNKPVLSLLVFLGFASAPAFAQDSLRLKTVEMVIKGKTFRGVYPAKGQTLFIDIKGKTIKRLSGDKRIKDDVYGIETIKRKGAATTYTCQAISDTPPHPQLITVDGEKRRIRFQSKDYPMSDSLASYVEYFY
ncbi:MAG: hypothetical protein M3Y12_04770 [Bacteroidota bacterium]|nr:hypothetical protein [Bacteroidota bacterium]